MAEERIGIKIEIYDPCGRCTIKDKCAKNIDTQAFLKDPHSCFQYKLLHRLPTKVEAIERMAKAMCPHPYNSCEGCIGQKKKQTCKQVLEGVKELSEAALNALLEAK